MGQLCQPVIRPIAQMPRQRAGQRDIDDGMDTLVVVAKYLTTGLHARLFSAAKVLR